MTKPEQFVVRDDYTFAIDMKAAEPDGARHGGAVEQSPSLDPELVKAHATKKDPWAAEWLKRNAASGRAPTRSSRTSPASRSCWRRRRTTGAPKPYFERVVLKFVPNEADRVLLLKRKAVDLVVGRPGLSPRRT